MRLESRVMIIYTEVIELVKDISFADEYGNLTEKSTSREVIATKKSVGMRESYEAAAFGFKPEIIFVLTDYLDYEDEGKIIYQGREYRVIRTYQKPEDKQLQIICERIVNNSEVYSYGDA